ncbi:MAG: outer membrane protein transport protein [Burkholderiales bacterium]|nr:outer membrane protein transport protein [Burkholderiales bacterium]
MRCLTACVLVMTATPAFATNGLNLIGYGAESSLMGGADIAVARDAAALNTNPAGIARFRKPAVDVYGAGSYALDVGHGDLIGNNNLQVDEKLIGVAGFGYALPLQERDLVLGIGAFVQGGAGAVFNRMRTPFGTIDELSSQFGALKLTTGLAWRATESTMAGATLSLLYGGLRQDLFPATSAVTPGGPFFGAALDRARGHGFGAKFGLMHQLTPAVTIGATYATKTRLPLGGGRLRLNMNAVGLGQVTYSDVSVDGLAFPQQAGAGFAWQLSERLLWSAKLEWSDWSAAVKTLTQTATGPDNPAAPAVVSQTQFLGWRDQTVLATGIAYALSARDTVFAGFNYGRSPVPAERSSPIINPIGEKHLTLGASRKLEGGYALYWGLEYQFRNTVHYNNPALPFGPSVWREESLALHLMLGRRW